MAKMKLGDILTDIVAPVGAMGLAAYGGRRGNMAAAIGMSAVNNIAENKRRKRLGETIASLADARAEADLKRQKAMYDTEKDIERKRSVEAIGGSMPDEWVGPLPPDSRLQQYIEDNPEPVRDQVYTEMGRVAMEGGDPEAAMAMMKDTEAVKARIDEASRMSAARAAEAYAGRELQRSEMEANRVFNETKLEKQAEEAKATQAYRDATLAQSGELGRQRNALQSRQIDATLEGKRHAQLGGQIEKLQSDIMTVRSRMLSAGTYTPEEIEAEVKQYEDQLDILRAEYGGAEGMIDLDMYPATQAGGQASPAPEAVTPAGADKRLRRADGSIAGVDPLPDPSLSTTTGGTRLSDALPDVLSGPGGGGIMDKIPELSLAAQRAVPNGSDTDRIQFLVGEGIPQNIAEIAILLAPKPGDQLSEKVGRGLSSIPGGLKRLGDALDSPGI